MRSNPMSMTLWVAGRALTATALTIVGLLAGAGSVLFPTAVPWAILGLSGLLLLWVLPDLQKVPERLAEKMMIPLVVSVLAVPSYYGLILPGLPWISIRRIIFVGFAFGVVITLSGSAAKRSELLHRLKSTPLLTVSLLIYFLTVCLATMTSTRPGTSISAAMNEALFELLPFVGTILIVKTERQFRLIFVAFITCVFIDLVVGGIESKLQHPFLIYAMPESMRAQLAESAGLAGLLEAGKLRNGMIRAFSIYNTALSWGEMSAMMAPICACFAVYGRSRTTQAMGATASAACFLCIYLSGSRGAYVGFIGSLLLFGGLTILRTLREKPNSIIGPLALCLCLVIGISTVSSVFFVGRVHRTVLGGGESANSNEGRNQQWILAEPKIIARPLLGYGPGFSAEVVGWSAGDLVSLDSYVLTLLIGVGVPGCFAFFAMLLAAICRASLDFLKVRSLVSVYGVGIGCCMLPYTIYRFTLSQTENNTLVFILIGLVVCLASLTKETSGSSHVNKAPHR